MARCVISIHRVQTPRVFRPGFLCLYLAFSLYTFTTRPFQHSEGVLVGFSQIFTHDLQFFRAVEIHEWSRIRPLLYFLPDFSRYWVYGCFGYKNLDGGIACSLRPLRASHKH
jgi:hypothetical protein